MISRITYPICLASLLFASALSADVSLLPLDEGTGSTAFDGSGNGNDGALIGAPVYEADTGNNSAFALRLDGVDDRIDLGALDVAGSGLTLSVWFQADSYPGQYRDPRLISKASDTAANAHVFMLSTIASGSTTRLRARLRIGGSTQTLVATSGDLTTDIWHHAALTHDGSTLRLYLDGVEVGSVVHSGAVDTDPALPVWVGAQPVGNTHHFDGLIDDVRILDRALTEPELLAIVGGNQVPQAAADSYTVDEDAVLTVDALSGVLANDSDGDLEPLQALLVDDVASGTLSLSLDGAFVYMPAANFAGSDSFTYQASDGAASSAVTTVALTVTGTNDAPVAQADSYQVPPDQSLVVDALTGVLANDSDPEGDGLTAVLDSGVLDVNSDFLIRADGSVNLAGQSWSGDLDQEEWVLVADPVVERSLIVNHAEDDTANDLYFPLEGQMTVLGFGRTGVNGSINQVPGEFTVGLSEATTHAAGKLVVDSINQPLEALRSATIGLGGGSTAQVTDSFDVDGPLQGYVVNNPGALPDVTQVGGRYRANLVDNTNDVTLHFNASQGRLDAKLVSFPFEYIAYNIGIGTQADSQVAPNSGGSPFMFAGVQVHVLDLNSPNSSHVVVGHRGSTRFTIEGKNTIDGVSSVSDDGANVLPLGRADVRIVGGLDQSLTVYWRQPNTTNAWTPYGGTGLLPGAEPAYDSQVYIGLITYAFRASSVPFVGTADGVELVGE